MSQTDNSEAAPRPATALLPAPSRAEVHAVIPPQCFEAKLSTSLRYAALSVALTVGTGLLALWLVPLEWAWLPVWLLYAAIGGTFATGAWVIAHECGHGAFCDNEPLETSIGFVLHSALLVPYFSWQRSHAIHHAKTNHLLDGETHVPRRVGTDEGERALRARRRWGMNAYAGRVIAGRLAFGWPSYLLVGSTGGPERGTTNHFWPWAPFSAALFPTRWKGRVLASSLGVLTTIGLLVWWALAAGSVAPVLALYVGPYLVVNAWLVTYTWLHHTDVNIPHYDREQWSYVRGAFCSVDRPYGRVFDLLHHRIGSQHVAHHHFASIPHYRTPLATEAIARSFPEHYRYDPTPILPALGRVASRCCAVAPSPGGWFYLEDRYGPAAVGGYPAAAMDETAALHDTRADAQAHYPGSAPRLSGGLRSDEQ